MPLSSQESATLKEVIQVGDQTALWWGEDRVSQGVWGIYSYNCRGSFTILDNFLTVGESAGVEEQASWHHQQPGGS